MSFLQKAKEKAGEVAREAADASTKAAGAVTARAQDPATQERVRDGLSTAGRTAGDVARDAADASARAAGAVAAKAQDPATQEKVRGGIGAARRGARTMVERIDPGILAEMIIKATALQEKANARLQAKGSIYRIGEIQVTASLPPGISFAIVRIADPEADPALHSSAELLAAETGSGSAGGDAAPAIVSLDGEEQAEIAFELAEAEASMEAAVDGLTGDGFASDPAGPRVPG